MERSFHNQNERFDDQKAERISPLADKRLMDWLLHRMLFVAGGTPNVKVANNTSAYFPDDSCLVEYVSGDRSTGVTFSVAVGVGFKKFSSGQPDADHPAFLPICVNSDDSFVTDNSDPTNPRIDRVFVKPAYADENSQSVDIIDPVTKNITSQSKYTNRAYRYELQYVAGTPAASPVPPAPPSGYIAADAIADILIQPGSGAFNPSDLTDTRSLLEMDDQLVPAVTTLPAGSITVSPTVLGQSDAQAALQALETGLATVVPSGLLNAKLLYVNTQSVKLDVAYGSVIEIEIDEAVLTDAGPITFDITTDRESPQTEDASTWYYLYVYDSASTLLPKLSKTAPEDNVALKVGYHPTNTGWRCVGAWYNNGSSNLQPGIVSDGWVRWYGYEAWRRHALGTTVPTNWTLQALDLPETADQAQLHATMDARSGVGLYGQSDASVEATSPAVTDADDVGDAVAWCGTSYSDSVHSFMAIDFALAIVDPTNPGFQWAVRRMTLAANAVTTHDVQLMGYFDRFMPRT